MQCIKCGYGNPTENKFCDQCGARLVLSCPACGHTVRPVARFCGECGASLNSQFPPAESSPEQTNPTETYAPPPIQYTPAHLVERIRAEQAILTARGGAAGERKTITALFADMAGSTNLIHDLDPEEARRLIDPVLELMMEAVHHYEGYVAKSLGDGILALFGAPIAHEDHSQRALYAALRMQEAMQRYADKVRLELEIPLQIRVGLHSGEVVVRSIRTEDLQTDYDPVGHSIHFAARMESIAPAGSIVVSESTYRLVEGYFEFKAMGALPIKGIPEPVNVYEVLGLGPLRTRLQIAARRGLVPFVGRQDEMAQLQQLLEQAVSGRGQIVGVVGEPGVGKSRLYYEFKLFSQKACLVLEAFSVSHGKAFACLPLIELLKTYLQIDSQDNERQRREKITGKVLTLESSLEKQLPYLLFLLGVAEPTSALAKMDPSVRRERTFEAIKLIFQRESLSQPLVLIFEDLQWLDRETEAFLDMLAESVASARILVLVNYRPEYQHDWGHKQNYTQLRLEPLGGDEAEELLATLLGEEDPTLTALKARILAQTEGNPFFMEEVVQTLLEEQVLSGVAGHYHLEKAPAALHIPATVQGVLSARIDRLPVAEKALLQTLAVIGKEFTFSLILQVVDLSEDELRRLLSRLQAGEFLFERPAFPEVEFSFKHGLTQEVAYGSVLLEQRSSLHERIAHAIESLFADSLDEYCSELAHHYSHSGNTEKAVVYLQKTGLQAARRSANKEAIDHLTRALTLIENLPESPQRDQRELGLQLTLGPISMEVNGYAAPEVEATYHRALVLCQRGGDSQQLFSVMLGLRRHYSVRAEYFRAQELAEQALELAQDSGDLVEAHSGMGVNLFFQGLLDEAHPHLEQSLALYDPQQHQAHAFLYGLEPGILDLTILAWILWFQGYPVKALQKIQELLEMAQERNHPFSLAHTLAYTAEFRQTRGEIQLAQENADAAIALATEHGFPFWIARGTIVRGWALAAQGSLEDGIAQIRQGLEAYRATGARQAWSYCQGLLVDALGRAGQTQEALRAVATALTTMDHTGERYFEAELHRLQGELIASSGTDNAAVEAEVCLRRAQEVAQKQGARSLELRSMVSLGKLLQREGRAEEAYQLLSLACNVMPEGNTTTDLETARNLLVQAP